MSDTPTAQQRFDAFSAVMDSLMEIAEAATGYRAKLESQGWSPAVAEQIAASWLVTMQTKAVTG